MTPPPPLLATRLHLIPMIHTLLAGKHSPAHTPTVPKAERRATRAGPLAETIADAAQGLARPIQSAPCHLGDTFSAAGQLPSKFTPHLCSVLLSHPSQTGRHAEGRRRLLLVCHAGRGLRSKGNTGQSTRARLGSVAAHTAHTRRQTAAPSLLEACRAQTGMADNRPDTGQTTGQSGWPINGGEDRGACTQLRRRHGEGCLYPFII